MGPATLFIAVLTFHYADGTTATLQTYHQFTGPPAIELCINARDRANSETSAGLITVHASCVAP